MTIKWNSDTLLGLSLSDLNSLVRSRQRHRAAKQLAEQPLSDLLSLASLERAVMRTPMHAAMVRAWKGGARMAEEDYTVESGSTFAPIRYVDTLKLFRCFEMGATLVFWDMQRYWEPITRLSWDLSAQLGCAATVSGWLSPPHVQGVIPHFDYHDIIVVQIVGSKEWLSFDKSAVLPLDKTRWRPVTESVDPRLLDDGIVSANSDILTAGDVMFLPRGDSHAVKSEDEVTLHLTISLHEWTPYDIASGVLACVAGSEELRGPLRLGHENRSSVTAAAMAAAIGGFTRLSESADPQDVSWNLYKNSHADLVETPLPLISQYACLASFGSSTSLRRRTDLLFALYDRDDSLLLRLRDRTLRLPIAVRGMVERIMSGADVSAASLDEPAISLDARIELLRTFLREGILVPSNS